MLAEFWIAKKQTHGLNVMMSSWISFGLQQRTGSLGILLRTRAVYEPFNLDLAVWRNRLDPASFSATLRTSKKSFRCQSCRCGPRSARECPLSLSIGQHRPVKSIGVSGR